ncbi:hypothetical protein [Streptomyces sp. NPDC059828]|uniref:hypothetical protein n=1 Tax=Streptomyces sp. NPDC059828 TaxID=3346965 RepID=UPI003660D769
MSSTYRILCLSHDPAVLHGEYRTPEDATQHITEGVEGHPACDLLIGRYSYPLVEAGCPASRHQPAKLTCRHGDTVWAQSDVLRLLVAAYQSHDEIVRAAVKPFEGRCWTQERLHRLRDELGAWPPSA